MVAMEAPTSFERPFAPEAEPQADWSAALGGWVGLADPFRPKVAPQLSVRRAWGEAALELAVGWGFSWIAPGLVLCDGAGACRSASEDPAMTGRLPGAVDGVATLAFVWRGWRGKASWAGADAESFLLEGRLGGGALRYGWSDGATQFDYVPCLSWGLALVAPWKQTGEARLVLGGLLYPVSIREDDPAQHQLLLAIEWAMPGAAP